MSIADLNHLGVRCRPIITWPGDLSRERRRAPFRSPWANTIRDLAHELKHVRAKDIVLELAISESEITMDGTRPKASAKATHPGVILSFSSRSGPLRFAVDAFGSWEDNLRAIALGMGDLRRIERYGITRRGEQYTGWRQLPSPEDSSAGPVEAKTVKDAITMIFRYSDTPISRSVTKDQLRSMYRQAALKHHPDRGGDAAIFGVIAKAWAMIEAAHGV